MTELFGDFDEARARVHEQAAQARQRASELRDVAAGMRDVQGSANSIDGLIRVTATTGGAITGLTIRDEALDQGGDSLADELRTLIAAAQRSALVAAADGAAQQLGAEHPMVADLQRSAERFADPSSGLRL